MTADSAEAAGRIVRALSLVDGAADQLEQALFALDHNATQSVGRHDARATDLLAEAFDLAPELAGLMPALHAGFAAGRFLAYDRAGIVAEASAVRAGLARAG